MFRIATLIVLAAAMVFAASSAYAADAPARVLKWETDLDSAAAKARADFEKYEEPKLIVVVFYSTDENSKNMIENTLTNQDLVAMGKDYYWVKVNTDAEKGKKFFFECDLKSCPAVMLFNHDKERLDGLQGRIAGPRTLMKIINKVDNMTYDYFDYKKTLEEDPEDLDALYEVGKYWFEMKRDDKAKEFIDKLLAKAGDDAGLKAKAYYYKGRMQARAQKSEKAHEFFKKAQEVDKENKSGIRDEIDFELAKIPYAKQLWKEAIKAFDEFIKNYPNSKKAATAMLALAGCYYSQNDTETAKKYWRKCAQEYPDTDEGKRAIRLLKQFK